MMSSEYSGCSCGTQVPAEAAVALDGTDIFSCGVQCKDSLLTLWSRSSTIVWRLLIPCCFGKDVERRL